MHINDLLKIAIEMDASDVHIKVGNHPQFRIHGILVPLTQLPKLGPQDTEEIAAQIMTEAQRQRLLEEHDLDLAYSLPGFGRFRGSIFRQRGSLAIALRIIPFEVRSFQELLLPPVKRCRLARLMAAAPSRILRATQAARRLAGASSGLPLTHSLKAPMAGPHQT